MNIEQLLKGASLPNLKERLVYDPETGIFKWTNLVFYKRLRGTPAGCIKNDGYIRICVNNTLHSAHRLAWLFSGRELLDGYVIDHIDGDKLNNRLANLRAVTKSVNGQNQRKPGARNKSGFLGVHKSGCKWVAKIYVNGKQLRLGTFEKPEFAYEAYLQAKRQHHEGCAI